MPACPVRVSLVRRMLTAFQFRGGFVDSFSEGGDNPRGLYGRGASSISAAVPRVQQRMKCLLPALVIAAVIVALPSCATEGVVDPAMYTFDRGALSPADIALNIPGLGPCTDNPDRTLHLNSQQPVTVLVHGCFGSSGLFRGLAQVLAFHGQQTVCFTYNDRDSLMVSSAELISALEQLASRMTNKYVTVIGYSQGALIARKALVVDRPDPITRDAPLRLVTVAGPFGGIADAGPCGDALVRVLTLGLIVPMCQIATGDKWSEITPASDFILRPGQLHPQVHDYLKIVTDERGSCRKLVDGGCSKSDFSFSLEEQRLPLIDRDPLIKIIEVKAGHVEIVGDKRVAPIKLIKILQDNHILNQTEPHRLTDLNRLLAWLY